MLFQQMDIADKTDKSFDASKATTEQLKALKKLQENAQSVTASQEYQGLLEEYERTKGDPKIKAQLQQKLAPFQAQQAAIMGTQSPRGAANVQQAQNAGHGCYGCSLLVLVLTLILMLIFLGCLKEEITDEAEKVIKRIKRL